MRTREITLGAIAASLIFSALPYATYVAIGANNSLPLASNQSETIIIAPANQPDDLVALARVETQSVVTVQCSNEVGSAWSAQVDLNSQLKSLNFNSYLITNYHVVQNCLQNQAVQLTLIDQSKVKGYVWAWDEMKDVAAIATSADIPSLAWSGTTPASGWWVGILGSPLGFPGVLSEGIISSINPALSKATTSASINLGNSGGPAFDRNGRVIGLATAKYANSEGMGILNGTPLLCGTVVVCSSVDSVWAVPTPVQNSDPVKVTLSNSSTTTANENQLNAAALMLLTSSRKLLAQASDDIKAAVIKYPAQKSLLLQVFTMTPKDPVIDDSVDDVLMVALFANEVSAFVKAVRSTIDMVKVIATKVSNPVATTPVTKKTSAPKVTTIDPKITDTLTSSKKSLNTVVAKPKTITCTNSLKTIKVTAVNAKCPLGYNLKVVISL